MKKKNNKRDTLIAVGVIELLVIVWSLVCSILVLTHQNYSNDTMNLQRNGQFIGWFQNHSVAFFLLCFLPLIIIFVVDGVYLLIYALRRESTLSEEDKDEIAAQAKKEAMEEAKKEILEEIRREREADKAKEEADKAAK